MRKLRLITALLAVLAASTTARAQSARPPSEVAVGVSHFAPIPNDWLTDDLVGPQIEARFTRPFTKNFAIEGIFTLGRRSDGFASYNEGVYLVQVRQLLPRAVHGRLQPFLTYGGLGYHAWVSRPASTIPQPGGGVIQRRADTDFELEEPLFAAVGGGVQYELNSHLAVRADAQLVTLLILPIGARYSVGVSIPFGHYIGR